MQEAKVILMKCPEGRRAYGVRIEKRCDDWFRTWAFPVDDVRASSEGYDKETFSGNLTADDEYPGCPYCGTVNFLVCSKCGKLSCWNGQERVQCPWCGLKGNIKQTEEKLKFGGGDM